MPQGRPATKIGPLAFEYDMPNVHVDATAHVVKHEVINGETIIQRIGRKPVQIQIQGICTTGEAQQVDGLVEFDMVTIRSDRWSGDAIVVDTTTSPMNQKDTKTNEWLFRYTITANEVTAQYDGSNVTPAGGGGGGSGGGGLFSSS